MNRWVRQLGVGLVAVAAGGIGFWLGHDSNGSATSHSTEEHRAEAPPVSASVKTQPLAMGTVIKTTTAYGTVQVVPGSSSSVSAPADAVVEKVLVTPGTTVARTTPVVALGPTPDAVLLLKQAVDASTAADRAVEDIHRRLTDQLATNADVLAAEQTQKAANTQLASLRERGVGESRDLVAGADGVVVDVTVTAGQVISPASSILTVAPSNRVEAVIGVESEVAERLKVGDAIALRGLHAREQDDDAEGAVRLVAAEVNAQTRLRDVFVTLAAGHTFAAGTFVVADVNVGSASGLVVPRSAVLPDEDESSLFVVRDGKAVNHAVKIVGEGPDQVVVESPDLKTGDIVVVEGNAELEDGMAVRTESASPANQSTTTSAPEDK